MIYQQLFFSFLQIGAFSFGGGYAAMPLIQAQVIDRYGWLTQHDFSDLVTIAEMTPGPIAINAATFVGNLMAGIPGAACATLGVVLPSCFVVTLLAVLYKRYRKLRLMQGILRCLRPAVVAMIFAAGLRILLPALFPALDGNGGEEIFRIRTAVYFLISIFLLRKYKVGPIKVMAGCGIAELVVSLIN